MNKVEALNKQISQIQEEQLAISKSFTEIDNEEIELVEIMKSYEKSSRWTFWGSVILSVTAIGIALASFLSSKGWEEKQLHVLEKIYNEFQE